MPTYLNGLALQNYRGVGLDWVTMPTFKSFNFFVGANNAGKSTVLNFVHDWLPVRLGNHRTERPEVHSLDVNRQNPNKPIRVRVGNPTKRVRQRLLQQNPRLANISDRLLDSLLSYLEFEGQIWGESELPYANAPKLHSGLPMEGVQSAMLAQEWMHFWSLLTTQQGGNMSSNWIPQTLSKVLEVIDFTLPAIRLIPALRQITPRGSQFDYSGSGLIERLMEIQNPDVERRMDRLSFDNINGFLRNVIDEENAAIEIPHNLSNVLVNVNDKVLPLTNLGTGIHQVIMIAAFCTLSHNEIICIEEPELHLHPVLQRKLIRYLQENTENQYLFATHSASFIDTPGCAVYHVTNNQDSIHIREAVLRAERHAICTDLGYRASDMVQANAVIWVEGPSDRIYLNHWIRSLDPELREGLHYSIMFYGGRLLSHLSADDEEVDEFIQLRDLNRNMAIMMDSDKSSAQSHIGETKLRIKREFEQGGSVAWITKGREVENYIDHATLQTSVQSVVGSVYDKPASGGTYDHALHFTRLTPKKRRSKTQTTTLLETEIDKVKVSRHVVANNAANLDILDLRSHVTAIVMMIRRAND